MSALAALARAYRRMAARESEVPGPIWLLARGKESALYLP